MFRTLYFKWQMEILNYYFIYIIFLIISVLVCSLQHWHIKNIIFEHPSSEKLASVHNKINLVSFDTSWESLYRIWLVLSSINYLFKSTSFLPFFKMTTFSYQTKHNQTISLISVSKAIILTPNCNGLAHHYRTGGC